jgi:hypothetical protein
MTLCERVSMPSFAGTTEWLGLRATRPRRTARPRRARELLDVDVHQLTAPGAVRSRVVAGLSRRRVGRRRGSHAGVLVRARRRGQQRPAPGRAPVPARARAGTGRARARRGPRPQLEITFVEAPRRTRSHSGGQQMATDLISRLHVGGSVPNSEGPESSRRVEAAFEPYRPDVAPAHTIPPAPPG